MEELLRHQPEVTLSNWLIEKGVERTGDDVRDIMSYYSFVPIPNGNSESVFTNNEILVVVIEWSGSYMHPMLNLVSKSFNKVLTSVGYDTTTYYGWYEYHIEDTFARMDWMGILTLEREYKETYHVECAARSGYWFKPLLAEDEWIDYTTLMNTAAEYSDGSDKYYRLFISLTAAREEQKEDNYDSEEEDEGDESYTLGDILESAIRSGDQRIFDFVWNEEDLDLGTEGAFDRCLQFASYYNRKTMLRTIEIDSDLEDYMDLILASAYCGGHYEEIREFFEIAPLSHDEIWKTIIEYNDMIFIVERLGLLTDLIRNRECDLRVVSQVFRMMYSVGDIEEFEDLWSIIGRTCESYKRSTYGSTLDRWIIDMLNHWIGILLSRHEYDEIRRIMTGRSEYQNLDIDFICDPKRHSMCERTRKWIRRLGR